MAEIEPLIGLVDFMTRIGSTNVVIAANGASGTLPSLHRLSLSQDVATEFYGIARDTVTRLIEDYSLRQYEAGYKLDSHEAAYLDVTDVPPQNPLVERVPDAMTSVAPGIQRAGALVVAAPPINDQHDDRQRILTTVRQLGQFDALPLFQEEARLIARLAFYVIVLTSDRNETAMFFRTYSPKKVLGSSRFAMTAQGGTYTKVENHIFQFDEKVDCIVWNRRLIIISINNFQRMFRYLEEIRRKADDTLSIVLRKIPIGNAEAFRQACLGQLQMLAKLASISRKDYLESLDMARYDPSKA